jgi:hypothetical protein
MGVTAAENAAESAAAGMAAIGTKIHAAMRQIDGIAVVIDMAPVAAAEKRGGMERIVEGTGARKGKGTGNVTGPVTITTTAAKESSQTPSSTTEAVTGQIE